MNKLPFLFGLAAALAPSIGLDMPRALVSPRKEPRPLSPIDHERIAAAQAKRERKAARLASLASKPPTVDMEDEGP